MRDVASLDPQTRTALADFRARLVQRYGARVRGLVLFGSRARGDHRSDSDADVAVFMGDTSEPIREQMDMAQEAYNVYLADGLMIQPWVFKGTPDNPDPSHAANLLKAVSDEGIRL